MGKECCGQLQTKQKRFKEVDEILERYRGRTGTLIRVLQETQKAIGYLPKDALIQIAEGLNLSLSKVYGVATFYSQFHLDPRGKYAIQVCQGTACHVRGAAEVMSKFERELKVEAGGTTDDLKFSLESVACLGACGLAPVVVIDGETYGRVTPEQVPELIKKGEKE